MRSYFLKKGGGLLLSLWCIATITFFLMHMLPGDPFIGDHPIPEEVLRSLRSYYGLDQPLGVQYFFYLKRIFSLDLGSSIAHPGRDVAGLIREGFGMSAFLGLQALVLAFFGGSFLGAWGSLKKKSWQDSSVLIGCAVLVSFPSFLLASLLRWLFCVKLSWFSVAYSGAFWDAFLPTIALAILPAAFIAKLARSSLGEILEQDYICTAKSKGLSMARIVYKHSLRGALLPVVSYLGPTAAHLITGSLMVEKIFSIPGLGKWMVSSLAARDYPMILGLTLFFSVFLMLSNFLADIICGFMDPRISRNDLK